MSGMPARGNHRAIVKSCESAGDGHVAVLWSSRSTLIPSTKIAPARTSASWWMCRHVCPSGGRVLTVRRPVNGQDDRNAWQSRPGSACRHLWIGCWRTRRRRARGQCRQPPARVRFRRRIARWVSPPRPEPGRPSSQPCLVPRCGSEYRLGRFINDANNRSVLRHLEWPAVEE